jgi:hypothetical protein
MPRVLLVVLALDALPFVFLAFGAITQPRQPDGIGEGIMWLMLLASGIPLFLWPAQVPLLLELGADPNLDAGPGTGPVYFACVNGRSDAVAPSSRREASRT